MKRCILHTDRVCNDCGECDDRCEFDPTKVCDNCFRCLESDARQFAEIPISGVFFENDFSPERAGEASPDLEDGYVLDSDESWKESSGLCYKTLSHTYGARLRRNR